ncbi:MAG: exodeoxyribonuclease VII large subunit [Bacteroidales bacterium]|nr:exodeoxyribonuclease VII large subunit [Bacteroidales bacterium]
MPEGSLSLSDLLLQVRNVLGKEFSGTYWIVAEILELHVNRSGHCYMELIEKSNENDTLLARAKGTIWASRYSMLRPFFETSTGTELKSGIKMLCKASVEFHAQYGFSLNITDIDPSYTLGDLARKKQEVIRKLREDGVMEMNKEIPFPRVPQRIAIISSETAAGYGDFMESIRNNNQGFNFHTMLFPAVMQGNDTPDSIISALDKVFESVSEYDCIVIIRGGGSKADLESYNNYDLAYFITQFPLPVITGIGHERDESVVDMVAALGLKTPTAVAEFLVDQLLAFDFHLSALHDNLSTSVKRIVQVQVAQLERYSSNLEHLSRGFLHKKTEHLQQVSLFLGREVNSYLTRKKDHLTLLETRTELVNPENILRRGYSMTLLDGKALTGIKNVKPGDLLETRLYKGKILSKVEKTTGKNGKR